MKNKTCNFVFALIYKSEGSESLFNAFSALSPSILWSDLYSKHRGSNELSCIRDENIRTAGYCCVHTLILMAIITLHFSSRRYYVQLAASLDERQTSYALVVLADFDGQTKGVLLGGIIGDQSRFRQQQKKGMRGRKKKSGHFWRLGDGE